MVSKINKSEVRVEKHRRIRNKISGTAQRPRLCVFRSNQHIYAQIIDDVKGVTLASASSLDKSLSLEVTSNIEAATAVGTAIAKKALEQDITSVVFDRSGYIYHGKVKALADAAREAGLDF